MQMNFPGSTAKRASGRSPRSRLRASVVRLVYEITVVGWVEIDVDIASELAIFVTDHRRAAREGNFRYFGNRDLGARRCSVQYWATFFHVVAKITSRRPPRRAQGSGWSGAQPIAGFGGHVLISKPGDVLRIVGTMADRREALHPPLAVRSDRVQLLERRSPELCRTQRFGAAAGCHSIFSRHEQPREGTADLRENDEPQHRDDNCGRDVF